MTRSWGNRVYWLPQGGISHAAATARLEDIREEKWPPPLNIIHDEVVFELPRTDEAGDSSGVPGEENLSLGEMLAKYLGVHTGPLGP